MHDTVTLVLAFYCILGCAENCRAVWNCQNYENPNRSLFGIPSAQNSETCGKSQFGQDKCANVLTKINHPSVICLLQLHFNYFGLLLLHKHCRLFEKTVLVGFPFTSDSMYDRDTIMQNSIIEVLIYQFVDYNTLYFNDILLR